MEFRSLRAEELAAWADHCGTVFGQEGHGVDASYFLRHYHNDPWRDARGILVAMDGAEIASTVRVFRRKIWLFGQPVAMGGIGEVSTKSEYRGQGLAGTLLDMAVDWMKRENLAVSVLYTGLHGFYRRHGWEIIPKKMGRYNTAGWQPCEGRRMEPGDLTAMMEVDSAADHSDWRVIREGEEYWRNWMISEIGDCVVSTDGGKVVAWMACHAGDDDWSVQDFRALPGYEGRFGGLCALAAELLNRQGRDFYSPAWLASGCEPLETMTQDFCMVRMNLPVATNGQIIDSTPALIAATGDYRDSNLDHF